MMSELSPMHEGVVPTHVYAQAKQASRAVAEQIAALVRDKAERGEHCVLGLATGSTPTGVYREIIHMHREEGLSLANVVTFNLDEYYPMRSEELQSYIRFMREHLFDHVDIDPANIHIPDGTLPAEQVGEHCRGYEQQIIDHGGIDLQLLGIGRTGHIGFNEPGSGSNSRTRMIWLDKLTRLDAASDFFGIGYVPQRAITMGVGTILDSKRVVLMAFGESKAAIVAKAVEGEITPNVAASFLQGHPEAQFVLDQAAAAELTRFKTPWLVQTIDWTPSLIRHAVTWLAREVDKPILKLTDEHYNEFGLQSLLAESGPASEINLEVFRAIQQTITGWPGGKPPHLKRPGDLDRPRDQPFPKRVLVFSPHPDDDVISMGGTLRRLAEHGHEVHVAYQVSGAIAVFDEDAIRFADFAADYNAMFEIDKQQAAGLEQRIEQALKQKQPGQPEAESVQQIKKLIRRGEARAAARHCGIEDEHLHFLDMPFYETGTVTKNPLSEADTNVIADLLETVQPHQIYAAGDLSDPHGTHRTCLSAITAAVERVRAQPWYEPCEFWLYRGAWQEWEPQRIEMAVPLSPPELDRKRMAIFKHESQKDKALFPGMDPREFWKRAEDRNRATAQLYDRLGLAEYEAIEGFVRLETVQAESRATTADTASTSEMEQPEHTVV